MARRPATADKTGATLGVGLRGVSVEVAWVRRAHKNRLPVYGEFGVDSALKGGTVDAGPRRAGRTARTRQDWSLRVDVPDVRRPLKEEGPRG